MSGAITTTAMVIVLAVGIRVRSYRLGQHSVSFDEASAITSITRFGSTEMIERCGWNVHPPLYDVLLHLCADILVPYD